MLTITGIETCKQAENDYMYDINHHISRMLAKAAKLPPDEFFLRFRINCIAHDLCAYWATGRASIDWCRAFVKADADRLCSYIVACTAKDCTTFKIIESCQHYLDTYYCL